MPSLVATVVLRESSRRAQLKPAVALLTGHAVTVRSHLFAPYRRRTKSPALKVEKGDIGKKLRRSNEGDQTRGGCPVNEPDHSLG